MRTTDLKPNPRNPRKITPEKLKGLEKSVNKFGDLSGIVYNRRSKQLISGHQRTKLIPKDAKIVLETKFDHPTEAMTVAEGYILFHGEQFKYREVDADETWETEAMIAANKHGGEWDNKLLKVNLNLPNVNLNLAGFDDIEIDTLDIAIDLGDEDLTVKTTLVDGEITDEEYVRNTPETEEQIDTERPPSMVNEAKVFEENEPELVTVIDQVKQGQIWQLGKHRLMCGNSLDKFQLSKLIDGAQVDLVYTDPPYGIDVDTDTSMYSPPSRAVKSNSFAKIIGDDSTETAHKAYNLLNEICETIVYWGGNHYSLTPSPCWIVWDKRVEENQRDRNSDCELAYVKHPKKKGIRIFRHLWKGMIKGSEHGEKRIHPTQKPIALAVWAIEECAPDAKIILDVFGGSGSTLMACEKMDRSCLIMELSTEYCNAIISRWERATGEKAELVEEAPLLNQ